MKVSIVTDHPIAYESNDHINPKGTSHDNTKNGLFTNAILQKVGKEINYADWGCAGGGFVKDFYDAGINLAVGVEGSDYSKNKKRAEWATIPDNLFTADITKPFHFVDENNNKVLFDVISCYDVLEHIPEQDLQGLIDNLKAQLKPGGYFVTAIADFPDEGYHVTLKPLVWWCDLFCNQGFRDWGLLEPEQYGRNSSFNVVFKNQD